MEEKLFKLELQQLKDIAESFKEKIKTGLNRDNTEIACIPTFVQPNEKLEKGKALVLDLGGTNYRVATLELKEGKGTIHPENGWKKDLSVMKTPGFTQEDLFREMADPINEIKRNEEMPIGYCFSYPAASMLNGDAKLIRWTKGVNIPEMLGQPVGQPLVDHLNKDNDVKFTGVKVINDTVASLFAGLTKSGYDAYIGLIVGTGTNLATFVDAANIKKLNPEDKITGLIPINLESGNFKPPHLIPLDDAVDTLSDNVGAQRFEKAVSGMYLGEILKAAFPSDKFESKFDAQKLTSIMNFPDMYKDKYVRVARAIYQRSAILTAASIVGLVLELLDHNSSIKRIRLIAEGSLFWSTDNNGLDYKDLVVRNTQTLLAEYNHGDIHIDFDKMDNANLIGTAIAALS